MSVLVTGGAGYIGGQLVRRLLDRGERPVILDDLSTGLRWAVPDGAAFVEGSVGDRRLVAEIVRSAGVTSVCHLAGSAGLAASVGDDGGVHQGNVAQSAALFEAALAAGVKAFVFSSSAAVYGPAAAVPLGEDDGPAPTTPYGRSKLATERLLCELTAGSAASAVVLRCFNVAGADPLLRCGPSMRHPTLLLKRAVQAALGLREAVEVYGTDYDTADGTCVRDYVHVADVVEATIAALGHLRAGGAGGTFNCGSGAGISVRQLLAEVRRQSGRLFRVVEAPRRPGDAPSAIARIARIRASLGWTPRWHAIGPMVAHALAWEERLLARRAA
jgi:UDP-glucose 4-epimerase